MEKYNFGEDEQYLLAKNLVGAKDFEELANEPIWIIVCAPSVAFYIK